VNGRLAAALVRLYPRAWRARYGEEFVILLSDHPSAATAIANVIGSAARERLIAASLSLSLFWRGDMDRRQHSLVLMSYAYLAAVAAGVNFYWTVADTPMAVAMHGHSPLFVSWRIVGVGSALALAAVLAVVVPGVIEIARWALAQRRWDVIGRLAVPPATAGLTIAWMLLAWRVTGGVWVPTPWDVTGDWAAPAGWPDPGTRWGLGLVTGALLIAGLVASAVAVRQAIARSDRPTLRGPWVGASATLLAGSVLLMTLGVLTWGWFAERYASADFHARNGGFFDSTNIVSWGMSGVLFVAAVTVATLAAREAIVRHDDRAPLV
jgi:hypothetical protein